MKYIITLITLITLLASCAIQHEHTLPPGQKFVDGEVAGRCLQIETRPSNNEQAEIILFQDGEGNDFTIYEK